MTHRERYAEACRRAFEGWNPPQDLFCGRKTRIRKSHPPRNPEVRWRKEDVLRLAEYCRQGLRSFEIAPLMNRSAKAIQKAFVRFRFPRLHNICPPRGKDNPSWNGWVRERLGYRMIRKPDHPYAVQGYVREHLIVVEEHLHRFLLPSEVVHHIDGNPANNDISNLKVFSSNGEHLRATLAGIPHNVSPENRRKLSEQTRKRWKSGA